MNGTINKNPTNRLFYLIATFINKLRQSPDIYPIKFYKKGRNFRRHVDYQLMK
jgi:hypothetical protein